VKLLFFISSLQCGGAERVCVTLCNHWAASGWDVTLATFDDGSELPFFPLDPRVRHVTLDLARRSTGLLRSIANNVRRLGVLRAFVRRERPDRILSFIDAINVLAVLSAAGSGIPVVVGERVDPAHHPIQRPWRILRRLVYARAFAIVVQTGSIADYFPRSWGRRIAVIPNPVSEVEPAEAGRAPRKRLTIVGMGRLETQKGFDLLIRAFAAVARSHPAWDLKILGEGSERAALEAQVRNLGLSGRVVLPGRDPAALAALRSSDLFVLSSRYEGFPNALLEAMACGLPVISFNCPSGPAEIVRDGVDGRLLPAEDVDALAAAISELAADEPRRRALGTAAALVASRFSVASIAARWERVLEAGTAS
jgi:glycosyltransferase involved in cell wall biosynthesis